MKSTLNDLKKYLAMYLNEGKTPEGIRILGSTGIREMCRPRQDYGAFGYYGYGLSMKRLDDLKVVEHGGSLPGVSSNIAWSNEVEAAVIVLCNTSGVPVRLISDALMRMYNGRNPVDRRDVWQETSWDEETILEAQGMYISGEGTKAELYRKKDGSLGARENGKEIPIIPVGPKTAIVRNQYSDLFIRLIQNEKKKGTTILMSSHSFEEVERTCDRVGIIRAGELAALDSVASLKAERHKIYQVSFATAKEAGDFAARCNGTRQLREHPQLVEVRVAGSMDSFLKMLTGYHVMALDTVSQDMEDIFMQYYGGKHHA